MAKKPPAKGEMQQLLGMFFEKTWPMWVGGVLLGMLNICLFMVRSPWGGSGGYLNWGQNIYKLLGIFDLQKVKSFSQHPYAVLCFVVLTGAFSGALLSREFGIRIPPIGEIIKGLIGGALMAIGATMGIGCTIGAFFSGWPALSGGALVLTLGLTIGTYAALRYLLWEMEHLPGFSMGKSATLLPGTGKYGVWQPILGVMVIIATIILGCKVYGSNDVMLWFVIIGFMMGMICQRSRFCIVRALREPFMTGESEAPVGVMAGLVVGIFGFTLIKYLGLGTATAEEARTLAMTWVFPHFWLRALIGGMIFGVGMTISGGCAIGTLWRAGEGHVKLWASAIAFTLVAPISKIFIVPAFQKALPVWAQQKVFLPDLFGYGGAVAIMLFILLLWYLFVKWNERTGKFSAI